ncbi:MAG TPA: hypothetical protein VH141_07990 [Pseudonocardia sp.]|nr:hypothetical protein [Pseudonocardia sp.]
MFDRGGLLNRTAGFQRRRTLLFRAYPLHRAELTDPRETVVAAAGLPRPAGEPHVLYSPGVDVEMSAARPLAADVSPGRPS